MIRKLNLVSGAFALMTILFMCALANAQTQSKAPTPNKSKSNVKTNLVVPGTRGGGVLGKQITTQVDLKFESAKDFDNFAAGRPPKPGEPIKGVGVIIQRRPGGSASMKVVKTDEKGKVTFVGLAPGNYSLTVQQLDSKALLQNNLSATDNYEVEVTGAGLVGGTMNRSWAPKEKKAYDPASATARTSVPLYTDSIDFEIKDTAPVLITIGKAH